MVSARLKINIYLNRYYYSFYALCRMLSQISNSTMLKKCNDISDIKKSFRIIILLKPAYEDMINSCILHYNVKSQDPFMSSEIKI